VGDFQVAIGAIELSKLNERHRQSGSLKGRSRNYIPVLLEGTDTLKIQEMEVGIIKVEGERVWGVRK
jgi:hypothetical protein